MFAPNAKNYWISSIKVIFSTAHSGIIDSKFKWKTVQNYTVCLLLFLLFAGKNAPDDLRLSALELKPNFKLMMVGSLEADIQDVQNSIDNRDVIDDFDDDNDERTTYNFHKMEVCIC